MLFKTKGQGMGTRKILGKERNFQKVLALSNEGIIFEVVISEEVGRRLFYRPTVEASVGAIKEGRTVIFESPFLTTEGNV